MADVRLLAELRADLAASASPWQLATFTPSNAFFSLDDDAPTGAIGAIVGERERERPGAPLAEASFLGEYARRLAVAALRQNRFFDISCICM